MCCHTPSFIQSFSTILSRTSLSHTILPPPASHTSSSFTHTSSHTIFHTQLCRTPSFTYYLSQVALAQAKATGAENFLDIKFMFRLPACLPSCVSGLFWHLIPPICRSAVMPHAKQMTLERWRKKTSALMLHSHHFHTHHLSHTTLSHTHIIFLRHTPSLHISFCHTQLF